MRKLLASALSVAALAGVTACSQTEAGNPEPQGSSSAASPSSPSSGDDSAVPKVTSPLDVSSFLNDPCGLMTEQDLKALQFETQGRPQDPNGDEAAAISGPACAWSMAAGGSGTLFTGIQTGNRDEGTGGVAGIKKSYDAGIMEYWELTDVKGYPAAFTGQTDLRDNGVCSMAVSVHDDLSLWFQADGFLDDPKQACTIAETAAGMAIQRLKAGS